MSPHDELVTRPVPELIGKIAVPASIGFFFHTMFNVVDTLYGGFIGTDAQAALARAFPVFFIVIAFSSGLGTGTTALIANALGRQDMHLARLYAAQSLTFGFLVSLVVTGFGLWSSPWLFSLMGATAADLPLSLSYMNLIFVGAFSFVGVNILNGMLTAQGDTTTFRNALVGGFLFNCALDPLFMYGIRIGGTEWFPALGFRGIALATVVIEVMMMVYMGIRASKAGMLTRECWTCLRPRPELYADLARQGFPASVNMMTIGIGIFIITAWVGRFGEDAVAAYGIATRIEQIALLPSIGLNFAALAISGQNFGAGRIDRIQEMIRYALRYSLYISVVGGALILVLARPLMRLFTHDPAVIDVGRHYLWVAVFVLWAYPILFIHTSSLQGMKKPLFAIWIGLYRQVAAPLFVFWLLTMVLDWGLWGIWCGVFVVTWSGALFTWGYTGRVVDRLVTVD